MNRATALSAVFLCVLAACRGPFVSARFLQDPQHPVPVIRAVLTDPVQRGNPPWRELYDAATPWRVILADLPPLVRVLNKLEVHGTLSQSGSSIELRATDGARTLFVSVTGPILVDQPTTNGFAETGDGSGTVFRSDVGTGTFFHFTLTGINTRTNRASGFFHFLAADKNNPSSTARLLAMEADFSMEMR